MSGTRLERALLRSARAAGAPIVIERHDQQAWHSATFAGDHHALDARGASGVRLDAWLARLGEADLSLPGHIVAELALEACARDAATTRFRLRSVTVATG